MAKMEGSSDGDALSLAALQIPADNDYQDLVPPQLTAQEKDLGKKAYKEFLARNFDATHKHLDRLLVTRSGDPLLVLNRAVALYHAGGYKGTAELHTQLAKVCKMMHVDLEKTESMDDVDQSVVYYNRAVILYYCRKYNTGLELVQRLYHHMEPAEESGMKKKVLSLLVALYLATHQPALAVVTTDILEKNLAGPDATKITATMQTRCLRYRVHAHLMSKNAKTYRKEMKALSMVGNGDKNAEDDISTYMKANFEYQQGSFNKALQLLNSVDIGGKTVTGPGQITPVMFYNNLGCIHTMMKKHNLGLFYYTKAMQENEKLARELRLDTIGQDISGKPLHVVGMSRHFEILHNMGIQLLHAGKPKPAFECLLKSVHIFSCSPRLWLRLAECCIMAKKQSNDEDRRLDQRRQVVERSVGSGVHWKVILGQGTSSQPTGSESGGMPAPTLEFATLCLRNALFLIIGDGLSNNHANFKPKDGEEELACPPGNLTKGPEILRLKAAVLASSAYVSLGLNDYVMARKFSEDLLAVPFLSPNHQYLGQMYLAEALVLQDQLSKAIYSLHPESIIEIGPGFSVSPNLEGKQELEKSLVPWTPNTLTMAQAYMRYNLAVCYAVREEFDKADSHLAQCTGDLGNPLPYQVYGLRLYLDLVQGRSTKAQAIIKESFDLSNTVGAH